MKIQEVLRNENIGKRYRFGKEIYEVATDGISISLRRLGSGKRIEEVEDLLNIIHGCFMEEVVDWSKVAVDTKVLISEDGNEWERRHFAKYEDGKVYCFTGGCTSFTVKDNSVCEWEYAKLYTE